MTLSVYDRLQECVAQLGERFGARRPRVGLILGSGLGPFANQLEDPIAIDYRDIRHFPVSSVVGHAGRLVLGRLSGIDCLAMQGRVHYYEGWDLATATLPARVMIALGCRTLLITNAAGGLGDGLSPGALMLIRDHLNLFPDHPLRGANDERLGPRFPDLSRAYAPELRVLARRAADRIGVTLHEGVYAGLPGPSYETPAEVAMLGRLGADAVGMSTVPEVIVANHMGARVLAISCITNMAAGLAAQPLSHDEVTETAGRIAGTFAALVLQILDELAAEPRGGTA